jgi:hypothetical protein
MIVVGLPKASGIAGRVTLTGGAPALQGLDTTHDSFRPLLMTGFLTKFRDGPIEKQLLRDTPRIAAFVRLGGTARGATDVARRTRPERHAIGDSARVFATDTCGIEAIAEGSS